MFQPSMGLELKENHLFSFLLEPCYEKKKLRIGTGFTKGISTLLMATFPLTINKMIIQLFRIGTSTLY